MNGFLGRGSRGSRAQALAADLRQRGRDEMRVQAITAIQAIPREECGHNDRPSCPKCARRTALAAAEAAVRGGAV